MKKLNQFITEKLKLGKNHIIKKFDDDELRKDYEAIHWATLKSEKYDMCKKYGFALTNRFGEIQLEILKLLRENRFNKNEFDDKDVRDFFRFDISDKKFIDYLKEESDQFVNFLYDYFDEKVQQSNKKLIISASTKRLYKLFDIIKKYLNK